MSKDKFIPKDLKPYFWDVDFDKLSIEDDKTYIITRLYCQGDLKAIKWLRSTYKVDDIREVALNSRNLNTVVANYLRQKLNLRKEDMAYYKNINSIKYEFGRGI